MYVYVHVLCMTLLSVLILTVGHDSTPKCVHMLCMTLSSILILTVGHDNIIKCVCVCMTNFDSRLCFALATMYPN